MNRNQISICILSFLTIFIITTFTFYSSGSPQLPRSVEENEIAELLHAQIFQKNLDEGS